MFFFFFQAEDGIRDLIVTGVQTCALPISAVDQGQNHRRVLLQRLLSMVSGARMDATRLVQELQSVSCDASKLADEIQFGFLWSPRRKLLSIGFDGGEKILHDACYDLLASEAR